MPEISRFYGIIIRMFYCDHSPPHFHAVHNRWEIRVGISPLEIIEGEAPARMVNLVMEWAQKHARELMVNWDRCRQGFIPLKISRLE